MKVLTLAQALQELAKALNKHCMYISGGGSSEEKIGAAPYLDPIEHRQMLADGQGFVIFDDYAEMRRRYEETVHLDGWEEDSPFKWYVVTCDAEGCLNPMPHCEGYDGCGRCRSCGAFIGESHDSDCEVLR